MILELLTSAGQKAFDFLEMGGGAMWAIGALSVLTLAVIFWKICQLAWLGAWSGGRVTRRALDLWAGAQHGQALALLARRRSLRATVIRAAMQAARDPALSDEGAQAETLRVARAQLARAGTGLRALELFATIGPLLGLFGTVTGMISAFQALQEAGARADPATLAGGIWEALLTTAAGMAIAIPAQIALTWFESISTRLRHEMEDGATLVFVPRPSDVDEIAHEDIAKAA
jgi:biopolymer transport protein ExbB